MKVLVTGGYGYIGSWLVETFLSQGYEVYLLSRKIRDTFVTKNRAVPIEADITNLVALKSALEGMHFDYCVHAASSNDFFEEGYAEKALLVNALGTRNLLEALSSLGDLKKLIYLSTFHVYGKGEGGVDETLPPEPRNDYATSHLCAEYYVQQFVRAQGFPAVIVRLSNGYGVPKTTEFDKWYLLLNDIARQTFSKKRITLTSNGKHIRDFVWIGDVCGAVIALCSQGVHGEVYNLGGGRTYSILEIAERVRSVYFRRYGQVIPLDVNEDDSFEPCNTLDFSCKKLQAAIGYDPTDHLDAEIENLFVFLENHFSRESSS